MRPGAARWRLRTPGLCLPLRKRGLFVKSFPYNQDHLPLACEFRHDLLRSDTISGRYHVPDYTGARELPCNRSV